MSYAREDLMSMLMQAMSGGSEMKGGASAAQKREFDKKFKEQWNTEKLARTGIPYNGKFDADDRRKALSAAWASAKAADDRRPMGEKLYDVPKTYVKKGARQGPKRFKHETLYARLGKQVREFIEKNPIAGYPVVPFVGNELIGGASRAQYQEFLAENKGRGYSRSELADKWLEEKLGDPERYGPEKPKGKSKPRAVVSESQKAQDVILGSEVYDLFRRS